MVKVWFTLSATDTPDMPPAGVMVPPAVVMFPLESMMYVEIVWFAAEVAVPLSVTELVGVFGSVEPMLTVAVWAPGMLGVN